MALLQTPFATPSPHACPDDRARLFAAATHSMSGWHANPEHNFCVDDLTTDHIEVLFSVKAVRFLQKRIKAEHLYAPDLPDAKVTVVTPRSAPGRAPVRSRKCPRKRLRELTQGAVPDRLHPPFSLPLQRLSPAKRTIYASRSL